MKLTDAVQLYGPPAAKSADIGVMRFRAVAPEASPFRFPDLPAGVQFPDGVPSIAVGQRRDFSGISPIGVEAVNGEVHILLRSIDGYIMRINAATHLEVFTPEDQVRLHTWMAEQREREQ